MKTKLTATKLTASELTVERSQLAMRNASIMTAMKSAVLPFVLPLLAHQSAHAMLPTIEDSVLSVTQTEVDGQLFSTSVTPNQTAQANAMQAEVLELLAESELAYHPSWLRLLHYPDFDHTVEETTTSRATQADFFVSPEGQYNPEAEMMAMVKAMLSAEDAMLGDDSVQCRFPARTYWLKEQLGLSLPQADCHEFQLWFDKYKPKNMSVVFAQEYPDSMTSAFAHMLLRVDTSDDPQASNHSNAYANSYAVNYTVDGDADHSMFAYAKNSMVGNYGGLMTIEPYLPKLENYLATDNRDVWLYPLNLTEDEMQQMMRHVWEVKDLGLPYYLLSDNCASEVLRLIDVVRPAGQLFEEFSTFVVPSEVVRLMDSQGLLGAGEYVPAVASQNQAKLQSSFLEPALVNLPANNNPVDGSNLQRATIGVGATGEHEYVELGGRVSYHDLLDPNIGYRQNLDMDTLNIKLRAYEDAGNAQDVQLQELTVLRGRSYNPINTARKGSTWGANLGLTQVNDGSVNYAHATADDELMQQHLVANLGVEKGVSVAFGKANNPYELPTQLCYAFGAGNVQGGRGLTNGFRIGAGANLGCAIKAGDKLRATAEVSVPYWYHTDTSLGNAKQGYWQPVASLGMQYDMAKNHSIRVTAEHELSDRVKADTDVQVAYQHYF